MMTQIKNIIFDFDGTLVDTAPLIVKTMQNVECFPGVIETLGLLLDSGYSMAIASSRSHQSLEEYVELFKLGKCFSMLVGGNDVAHGKPDPEPVQTILNAKGWNADETLVVGDATVDIQMGKAAGTRTCAVTYGNGTVAELNNSHPDHIKFCDLTGKFL